MSTEEAARRIQAGEQGAIPLLWEGVKKFARLCAPYLLAGITAILQPSAETTFNSVSSCGMALLLSRRAITD